MAELASTQNKVLPQLVDDLLIDEGRQASEANHGEPIASQTASKSQRGPRSRPSKGGAQTDTAKSRQADEDYGSVASAANSFKPQAAHIGSASDPHQRVERSDHSVKDSFYESFSTTKGQQKLGGVMTKKCHFPLRGPNI